MPTKMAGVLSSVHAICSYSEPRYTAWLEVLNDRGHQLRSQISSMATTRTETTHGPISSVATAMGAIACQKRWRECFHL